MNKKNLLNFPSKQKIHFQKQADKISYKNLLFKIILMHQIYNSTENNHLVY